MAEGVLVDDVEVAVEASVEVSGEEDPKGSERSYGVGWGLGGLACDGRRRG